jgi:hypothetical protein
MASGALSHAQTATRMACGAIALTPHHQPRRLSALTRFPFCATLPSTALAPGERGVVSAIDGLGPVRSQGGFLFLYKSARRTA